MATQAEIRRLLAQALLTGGTPDLSMSGSSAQAGGAVMGGEISSSGRPANQAAILGGDAGSAGFDVPPTVGGFSERRNMYGNGETNIDPMNMNGLPSRYYAPGYVPVDGGNPANNAFPPGYFRKAATGQIASLDGAPLGDTPQYVAPVSGQWAPTAGNQFHASRGSAGRQHSGNDIRAPKGTPAVAVIGGKVIYTGYAQGYAWNAVVLGSDGNAYRYATHGPLSVKLGQEVAQGQKIGTIDQAPGVPGPHLHFEVIPPTIDGKPNKTFQKMVANPGQFVDTQFWPSRKQPPATVDPMKFFGVNAGSQVVAGQAVGDPTKAKAVAANPMEVNDPFGVTAFKAGEAPLSTPALAAATAEASGQPPPGSLYRGQTSPDVMALQMKLSDAGLYKGRLDGQFGNQTLKALKSFQKSVPGLQVDGIAGPETLAHLGMAPSWYSHLTPPAGGTAVQPIDPMAYALAGGVPQPSDFSTKFAPGAPPAQSAADIIAKATGSASAGRATDANAKASFRQAQQIDSPDKVLASVLGGATAKPTGPDRSVAGQDVTAPTPRPRPQSPQDLLAQLTGQVGYPGAGQPPAAPGPRPVQTSSVGPDPLANETGDNAVMAAMRGTAPPSPDRAAQVAYGQAHSGPTFFAGPGSGDIGPPGDTAQPPAAPNMDAISLLESELSKQSGPDLTGSQHDLGNGQVYMPKPRDVQEAVTARAQDYAKIGPFPSRPGYPASNVARGTTLADVLKGVQGIPGVLGGAASGALAAGQRGLTDVQQLLVDNGIVSPETVGLGPQTATAAPVKKTADITHGQRVLDPELGVSKSVYRLDTGRWLETFTDPSTGKVVTRPTDPTTFPGLFDNKAPLDVGPKPPTPTIGAIPPTASRPQSAIDPRARIASADNGLGGYVPPRPPGAPAVPAYGAPNPAPDPTQRIMTPLDHYFNSVRAVHGLTGASPAAITPPAPPPPTPAAPAAPIVPGPAYPNAASMLFDHTLDNQGPELVGSAAHPGAVIPTAAPPVAGGSKPPPQPAKPAQAGNRPGSGGGAAGLIGRFLGGPFGMFGTQYSSPSNYPASSSSYWTQPNFTPGSGGSTYPYHSNGNGGGTYMTQYGGVTY